MKKSLFLGLVLGLLAFACNTVPTQKEQITKTTVVQVADPGMQIQAPIIRAADELTVPAQDSDPAPIKWLDENLLSAISGIVLIVYEFLARKIPTSKSVSILSNVYKLIAWFVPDKTKNGGAFTIRE